MLKPGKPYLGLCVEADSLLAVEVCVAEERAAGSSKGHHRQWHGDRHVYADLKGEMLSLSSRKCKPATENISLKLKATLAERFYDVSFHLRHTRTCPTSISDVNFLAVAPLVVKIAVPFPYLLLLISSIASSRVSTLMTHSTGPKISSLYAVMSRFMLVMIVGPTKLPLGYFSTLQSLPSSMTSAPLGSFRISAREEGDTKIGFAHRSEFIIPPSLRSR